MPTSCNFGACHLTLRWTCQSVLSRSVLAHGPCQAGLQVSALVRPMKNSMHARVIPMAVVAGLLLGLSAAAGQGAPVGGTPVVEKGRLVNQDAQYSFALPVGWNLRDGATSEKAIVVHAGSQASFLVARKAEASDDLETEFKGLKLSLPFVGGRWTKLSEGWRKVGGKRAGQVEARRTYPKAEPLKQWDLVVVYRGRAYLLEGEVPESQVDARWTDLVSIVDSFEWTK